jgi:hypothetical protein
MKSDTLQKIGVDTQKKKAKVSKIAYVDVSRNVETSGAVWPM